MKPTYIFPAVMIIMDIGAAVMCVIGKDYKKAVYWVARDFMVRIVARAVIALLESFLLSTAAAAGRLLAGRNENRIIRRRRA